MAGDALALRDLGFVVRKDVVRSPGVDVEPVAEQRHRHRRTFDVPAGEARTPGAGPNLQPVLACALPEREIPRMSLARIHLSARAGQELVRRVARKLAVRREGRDVVVDGTADLIRVPAFDQLLDELDHLLYVVSGVR